MITKTICVIGQTKITCQFIAQELKKYFHSHIKVITWPLQYNNIPLEYRNSDIFIVTSQKRLEAVRGLIPNDKITLIAERTINLERIHKLLELEEGTKAILVQNSYEMAVASIDIIHGLGIRHIELSPYYPDLSDSITDDIKTAITPGMSSLVPKYINRIINLGTNMLDFSVYAEIVYNLNLPKDLLNTISHNYIQKILNITTSSLQASRENYKLKCRLEVILNTVNESIIAIDESKKITLINPMAEKTLNVNSNQVIGKVIKDIIPKFEIDKCLDIGKSIVDDIKENNNTHYVINKNLILDEKEHAMGVVATIRPATEVQKLETKIRQTLKKKGHVSKYRFEDILGNSKELINSINSAKNFAKTDLNVLLVGESGTGKELFAQSIHNFSSRKKRPFVALNFAAFPDNLVESELFGYEGGSFTGARKGGKPGLFEEAHTGTIFLDEIGDASLDLQKKLLRILEEREVRRIGGNALTPIDVRIIAATNQNLEALVTQKLFRSDLFFRLCTLPINIPALRYREDDVLFLINYFADKNYSRKLTLDPSLVDFILSYRWPGNIRELENVVDYMCNTTPVGIDVKIDNLPYYILGNLDKAIHDKKDRIICNTNNVIRELKSQGNLKIVFLILEELKKAAAFNKGLGRLGIKKRIKVLGITIQESRIKDLLKKLGELGYISIGATKQGSKITIEGEEFLSILEENIGNFI